MCSSEYKSEHINQNTVFPK